MALIPCKKCGSLVSDKADACPVCHTLLNEQEVVEDTLKVVDEEVVPPPMPPVVEEKSIQQEEVTKEPQANVILERTSSNRKIYMGIAFGFLLIVGIVFFMFLGSDSTTVSSSEVQVSGKRSFQDFQTTKYFKKGNVYYSIDVKLSWPEALEGGEVKPLQVAIMSKAFGFSRKTIDEALAEYFKSYGEEISQLPEWNGEIEQYYVSLIVEEECYVSGRYSAFSIYHMESAWGGSPHAAKMSSKFVNYDIQNQQVLGFTDIFEHGTTQNDVLRVLKTNQNIDWGNVKNPDELPVEILLTNEFLVFDFRGWQTATERASINWWYLDKVSGLLSKRLKELFGKEENTGLANNEERFLKEFYTNYIFGRQNFNEVAKTVCTSNMLSLLKSEYEYDCEDGECYAIWIFRTNSQDGPNDISEVQEVTNIGDGWYKVTYLDMGNKGETLIRLINRDNKVLIDDIKKDKSF